VGLRNAERQGTKVALTEQPLQDRFNVIAIFAR
jgi:hypothetical protein